MKRIKTYSSYNLNENEQNKINIDSSQDGVSHVEEAQARSWKFYPIAPLTVKSAEGKVEEEIGYVVIELSNGDKINFSSFWPAGGNAKVTASITINGKKQEVVEEFKNAIEEYSSYVSAVLHIYEKVQYSDEEYK